MLLHIPEVLTAAQLADVRRALSAESWVDGAASSGAQAVQLKRNRQLGADSKTARDCGALIVAALERHPLFISAALPRQILPPLFNRYEGGGHYGNHVDNAIQRGADRQPVRTDVSITVFLTDPEDYAGGELIVDDTYGAHEVKLPAGDAIIYPSTSLHRVEPVTDGARVAAVSWIQSMVRDDWQRAMLFNLDMTILQLRERIGDSAEVVALTSHYHNLLRQWAQM